MRGHQALIDMRMRGYAPVGHVTIDVDGPTVLAKPWPCFMADYPLICDEKSDSPTRCDLRFLVGLEVNVTGCDESKVRGFYAAAVKAKAARVMAILHDQRTSKVLSIEDSKGELTWQN
jgi:hypothetical protein